MLNFANQSPDHLMNSAYAHHMAGRHAQAEPLYRQVLAINPNHPDALHLLGVLACQVGKPAAAVELLARAVTVNPQHPTYRSNYGESLRQTGALDRAEAEFKQAIALNPRLNDAYTNLASVHLTRERWDDARAILETFLRATPDNPTGWRLLGDALSRLNHKAPAIDAYRRALALQPNFADASYNLGVLLAEAVQLEEAVQHFRNAIAGNPEDWDARVQLADALVRLNRPSDAYQELSALVAKNPKHAVGYSRLANVLRNGDHVDKALVAYARAVELDPKDWITRSNMAFALRDQARLAEAVDILRSVLAEDTDRSPTRSGMIFTMHLLPEITPTQIAHEQQLWNRRHLDAVAPKGLACPNTPDPHRRLRIGYVSSDFRAHPVGRFMLPLLRNHDRAQVEVFCYRGSRSHDPMTDQIAAAADHFAPISHLTDDDAAALIRKDQIDILIDLSNHTIDNRMMLFARKPAPLQISYLAYNAGTGLETFDYRLTDPFIDPPGIGDDAPFEKPLRLAETYWCYAPMAEAGDIAPLPALAAGTVTFGCFNYFSKCNDQVLALFARVLQQLPAARLLLHVPAGERQDYVKIFFAARGISPQRLELFGRVSEKIYFENYNRIDIALDTFPWAGGTTTCDALYMGVPVITLAPPPDSGRTLQRGGISLLSNLGRPEWIASSPEHYISLAHSLAADLPRLADIRQALRPQMQSSNLMNAPRFARHVDAAYRHAWQTWCANHP